MAITRKTFEAGNFKIKHTSRVNHPVAILLKENIDKAFTIKEISKKLKMKESTIRSMLYILKKEGHIAHKIPYVAWKNPNNPTKKKSVKKK